MKIELGKLGQENLRYALRIGERGLPMFALTKRPAGVEKDMMPKHVRHDIKTGAAFPESVELGTLGTNDRLYRLRWTDRDGKLTKPYLTRRPATDAAVEAVEKKWQMLKNAAAGAVKDAVKEVITPDWTKGLIAFHTAAFMASQFNPDLVRTIADSSTLLHLDSFLFHTDWQHLIGNMIPLYILGREAEKNVGGKGMLLTYLLSGLTGSSANIADNIISSATFPEDGITLPVSIVGASGAVMGLLGLSTINALKEKSLGKFALLGTAATMLMSGAGMGPAIDKLGHTAGFVAGAVSGLFQKPSPHQIQDERMTQMRTALLTA